ncbi:MAG: tRNA (adenosine(37)-N6)-dimethylallyltransferase MiaA [Treponema sp.]|nr:tRNA (adenosine(37)-N6)-dimethylallyltransferase MiaA [Treponema sp.]
MGKYNCIVLLGPTAVGKTAIGVQLASHFKGEIISADSRQTYRGLDIGSGKDLKDYFADGKPVPYHMIDIVDLSTEYNVFHYQQDFYRVFDSLIKRNVLPVIVGGTGMYLDAVVRNYELVDVPEDPVLRKKLESKSLEELGEIYLKMKPDLHTKVDLLERDRVIRGIEIYLGHQEPRASELRAMMYPRPDIRPLIMGTTFDRALVRQNIETRLKERLEEGMLDEVKSLHDGGVTWERLEKLGLEYRYCAMYLQGKFESKEKMIEELFISIRQFAKRQETWFRFMEKNGVEINWLPAVQDKQTRIEAAVKLAAEYFEEQ